LVPRSDEFKRQG